MTERAGVPGPEPREEVPIVATGGGLSGGVPMPVVGEGSALAEDISREGLELEARSLWRLGVRRFLRHRLAMVSLIVMILIFAAGVFADRIAPYEYDQIDLLNRSTAPTLEGQHFFGTDPLGRDYFSRVVFGIRTSVRVALLVSLLSTMFGALVGAIAGYFGGWLDNLLMRMTDLFLVLPILPVLLVAAAYLGQGSQYRVAIILAFLLWTSLARIVRGTFLSLKEKEYVEAAKALGASDRRIIIRHLLPNTMSPIIVNATITVAIAILLEASLSFLGFGIEPPTPALGKLIDDGSSYMLTQPWLVIFPGITIVLICLCINFVGDGMRDALDPQQRRVRA